ncbi:endonuclease III [Methanocaldococcus villosus KIN24-T80]|uniref:Endonuclease III n=1 Tax=Methanocaldococcus villosus KIN24-T80 TaxID=1069083 RepID=N6V3B2_9EURY|nr:DUF123 domain-containing protein [Methanocaldococcus villosus]ENN96748.1 endonuclease III [Methanocaldococcus villosus KIN24-T80]
MEMIERLLKRIDKKPAVVKDEPFKVLVAALISARTNDNITEKVMKKLFKEVKDLDDLLEIDEERLSSLLYPVGFYRNKAKLLKKLAKVLKERYNGKIPDNLEDLLSLPGVGRKTANLVLTLAFDKDGIAVDTHVHRITNRWEIVDTETPEETEMVLRKKLDRKYWKVINHILVVFGREICGVKPKCSICYKEIKELCPYYKKLLHFEHIIDKFKYKKVSKSKIPNEKGSYILKIKLKKGRLIRFGKNEKYFKSGYYFYVGSAMNGLKNRIERHLKNEKKMFWHIDYLLNYGKIEEIYITNNNVECETANEFIKAFDYIEGFGCSDCSCKSHLFYMKL